MAAKSKKEATPKKAPAKKTAKKESPKRKSRESEDGSDGTFEERQPPTKMPPCIYTDDAELISPIKDVVGRMKVIPIADNTPENRQAWAVIDTEDEVEAFITEEASAGRRYAHISTMAELAKTIATIKPPQEDPPPNNKGANGDGDGNGKPPGNGKGGSRRGRELPPSDGDSDEEKSRKSSKDEFRIRDETIGSERCPKIGSRDFLHFLVDEVLQWSALGIVIASKMMDPVSEPLKLARARLMCNERSMTVIGLLREVQVTAFPIELSKSIRVFELSSHIQTMIYEYLEQAFILYRAIFTATKMKEAKHWRWACENFECVIEKTRLHFETKLSKHATPELAAVTAALEAIAGQKRPREQDQSDFVGRARDAKAKENKDAKRTPYDKITLDPPSDDPEFFKSEGFRGAMRTWCPDHRGHSWHQCLRLKEAKADEWKKALETAVEARRKRLS